MPVQVKVGRGTEGTTAEGGRTADSHRGLPSSRETGPGTAPHTASGADSDGIADAVLEVALFRRRLMAWYRSHARALPWRGVSDPYRTWVSEVMLQQTRVAAVIEHYERFLRKFPTLVSLALAPEPAVLAAWSGLGYYRRARMLHKAAQFVTQERGGVLPGTSVELRTLPGVGEYTCAAIASIAFGESIAVVDGNVERVLLRLAGRDEVGRGGGGKGGAGTRGAAGKDGAGEGKAGGAGTGRAGITAAAGRALVQAQANALVPRRRMTREVNAAGDHNQAMMELGATLCLPRGPLCLQCPVYAMCRTRGEHLTAARTKQRSVPAAFLLSLRKRGTITEVLLARRGESLSLMPGMYELPPLGQDAVKGREPVLRVRHSITNTNYYVQVFAARGPGDRGLRRAVPTARNDLHWVRTSKLGSLPMTGLARKVLQRLDVMEVKQVSMPGGAP